MLPCNFCHPDQHHHHHHHHNRHHHPHHHLIIITDHHVDLMMNWVRSLCTHIYDSRRRKKKTLSNRDLKLVLLTSAGSKIIKRLRSGKGEEGDLIGTLSPNPPIQTPHLLAHMPPALQLHRNLIRAKIPSVTDASAPLFHQCSPNYKYQQLLSFIAV